MLKTNEPTFRENLGSGLVMRTATDERDVERVAVFNGAIHGPEVDAMTRQLFLDHPSPCGQDLVFVEERGSRRKPGRVVSSLCLIPWTICYEGIVLPVGEMGIVGTLEEYRQRGLIRAQVRYFERRLDERGCLMSIIEGIPYFYRQFGYEYALPLEPGVLLELRDVPQVAEGDRFGFRRVADDDLPVLLRLYDEAVAELAISARRDEDTWRYLLRHSADASTLCERWLIEGPDGNAVGYFGIARYPVFGSEFIVVSEVSRLGHSATLATLAYLKGLALERGKLGIRLSLPDDSALVRLARSLGARDQGAYAWQIRFPAPAALLGSLAPVLERRLAASAFAGLTQEVRISLYRETILLRFEDGRLTGAINLGCTGSEAVRMPPLQLIPLVLGYRTLRELHQTYPDAGADPKIAALVDVLFPRVSAFLYTAY